MGVSWPTKSSSIAPLSMATAAKKKREQRSRIDPDAHEEQLENRRARDAARRAANALKLQQDFVVGIEQLGDNFNAVCELLATCMPPGGSKLWWQLLSCAMDQHCKGFPNIQVKWRSLSTAQKCKHVGAGAAFEPNTTASAIHHFADAFYVQLPTTKHRFESNLIHQSKHQWTTRRMAIGDQSHVQNAHDCGWRPVACSECLHQLVSLPDNQCKSILSQ